MPNKKNLHIVDSYKVWDTFTMKARIHEVAYDTYNVLVSSGITKLLNRSWKSLYIEWWIHNIGYYLTLPLCKYQFFAALNKRFKDVDLEEWK